MNMNLAPSPELRALLVMGYVPHGCKLHPITNEDSAPHLRPGEFAIVDTTDTEPQNGELYLIRWLNGGGSIVQAFCRTSFNSEIGNYAGWWTRTLRRVDYDQEIAKAAKSAPPGAILSVPRGCMVDGPRLVDTFREALVGRVIAIYQAELDAVPMIGGSST